jgi:predicted hydrocarbon binding protein
MAHPSVDHRRNALVTMTRDSLLALRTALFRDLGPGAATTLQEAGYAGAPALYAAFGAWVQARGPADPSDLSASVYAAELSAFLEQSGWGTITAAPLGSALAIDTADWAEADPSQPLEFPGCYFTAGFLADLFGRLSDMPVAVMEVECRSMGHEGCRFLVGGMETIQHVYDQMGLGVGYAEALGA